MEAIYRENLPYVWHSLRRLGVADKDLEDLAHDVFMVVHRRFADYDRARPIKPWLFGISFRVAADHLRKASTVRERLDEELEAADESDDALAKLESAEQRRFLAEALDALDLEKRAVFVLHEIDELPAPEIAAALELPLNTVYSRLRVAREAFQKAARRLAKKKEIA